jgi:hypothetical protein
MTAVTGNTGYVAEPDAVGVALGEHGPPWLAQARDHGDSGPGKPALGQLVAGAVLQ